MTPSGSEYASIRRQFGHPDTGRNPGLPPLCRRLTSPTMELGHGLTYRIMGRRFHGGDPDLESETYEGLRLQGTNRMEHGRPTDGDILVARNRSFPLLPTGELRGRRDDPDGVAAALFSNLLVVSEFDGFRALSFDCYGTLIDWETGMSRALREWADAVGLDVTDRHFCNLVSEIETVVQGERSPALLYPEVLAEVLRRIGARLGAPVSDAGGGAVRWECRGVAGLRRLGAGALEARPAVPAHHRLQRRPGVLRRQQPAPGSHIRQDHHSRGRRRLQASPPSLRGSAGKPDGNGPRPRPAPPCRPKPLSRPRARPALRIAVGLDRSRPGPARTRGHSASGRPRDRAAVAIPDLGGVRRCRPVTAYERTAVGPVGGKGRG